MPVFACATNSDNYCSLRSVLLVRVIYAVNEDEALGNALSRAKEKYPTEEGWSHSVIVLDIPTKWMEETIAYEKKLNQRPVAIKKSEPDGNKKEGIRNRQGTV